ncbi:RNA-guided endonuclease IscB [Bacillus sp. 03113]|uniref:RNA-guided endonuclease IscB n=1 Tax=Bacillus sp. 03113 TaxID=2578211 RepID=UPI00114431D6|nr:RNA-guided endonuclease IscB [Bacillus sp. 03113]
MAVYCFVLDQNGKPLSPTKENKGWYLIRKGRAILVKKYPMVIQLKKEVTDKEQGKSEFVCGIDDGSKYAGIAIVQKGKSKNIAVFKGIIEQRHDVKKLMDVRRAYRRYRRSHKRYRQARFQNRSSSKRKERIAPSIKQKRDAILRVVQQLMKWIPIHQFRLEDVLLDVRKLTEGRTLYKWQYQKSNRLDENLRKATLLRDQFQCKKCGAKECRLEAHHITPKRFGGANTISNLITLCSDCHSFIGNHEMNYADEFYSIIKGKNIRFDYVQHVMQGKTYLRNELSKRASLELTTGCDTANKRIDYEVEKTHSNDALMIANLNGNNVDIKEYKIRPMRRKRQGKTKEVKGFNHRDIVKYTKRNGEFYIGWITALYPDKNQCNITTFNGEKLKRYGMNRLKLLWKCNKIQWFV